MFLFHDEVCVVQDTLFSMHPDSHYWTYKNCFVAQKYFGELVLHSETYKLSPELINPLI